MTYSFPTRLSTDVGDLVGHHVVELAPGYGRRHLRPHPGPHAPRAEHRLVRRVLVEVDEDSAPPLLLPPRRRDEVRVAALELAGQRDSTGTHLVAVPARHEPRVDVEPSRTRRLDVRLDAQLLTLKTGRGMRRERVGQYESHPGCPVNL